MREILIASRKVLFDIMNFEYSMHSAMIDSELKQFSQGAECKASGESVLSALLFAAVDP